MVIVGTATAGNNFFRQIGSTVGVSVIGSVFTARLTANLADKIPASAHVTLSNLTPDVVDKLSDTLKHTIAEGYSDALLPLFIAFVPICVVIFILMIFIIPHPLATKIKHTGHTLPDEH
ncbi:MAG: hypothetical protein LUB61_00880 [Eggerthellaceae bacterium]|nr:hypothetical protein [Eggerthellaceae bacterium]